MASAIAPDAEHSESASAGSVTTHLEAHDVARDRLEQFAEVGAA
jgi:hypothetical protein